MRGAGWAERGVPGLTRDVATSVPMYPKALVWAQLAEPQTPSLKESQVPRQQAQICSASPGPAHFPAGAFCLKLPSWGLLSCIPCAMGPSSEHRSGLHGLQRGHFVR